MNIQFASDLHLEFLRQDWPLERIIAPAASADVLVLAGDIANGAEAFGLFADWPSRAQKIPVIYVNGNHEFYGHAMEALLQHMRSAAQLQHIHFLENASVAIGNVRFLGASLWTDYILHPEQTQAQQMEALQRGMSDHRLIHLGDRLFTAQDALQRHLASRAWLVSELAKPWAGKTVVVTHHGPHPLSIHPRYADHPLNAGFVSDLSEILHSPAAPDLWLHGHVHDSFAYTVGRTRVVTNPAGYIRNRAFARSRADFAFENEAFNPGLVVAL